MWKDIRGGIEDNSKIIFLFLHKNICCDPILDEMVLMMGHKIWCYGDIWLIIPVTPSNMKHWTDRNTI